MGQRRKWSRSGGVRTARAEPVGSETRILELVNEILESREQPFDECRVEIEDDLSAAIDRGAVASILGNLIENAWKYTRGTAVASVNPRPVSQR